MPLMTYVQSENDRKDELIHVAADLRWPEGTGIGVCRKEHLARIPQEVAIHSLKLRSRIGHPVSPYEVGFNLLRSKNGSDVFWSPGFIPPAWSKIPNVVTVHDLIHLHFYSRRYLHYYNKVLKPMYRRCSAIICVSNYTRHEFIEWSGINPAKVHTVYNGVSGNFYAGVEPENLGFPYIFYPGNKRSYKNLDILLRAYKNSKLPGCGIKCVMTGFPTSELLQLASSMGITNDVKFLGHVTDEDLAKLYRGAELTTFISLYEGFGLPILESMAVGTPVLTSNASSMPEIAGNAALTVDPGNLDEITNALNELISNSTLRASMSAMGLRRAALFSWDSCSKETWKIVLDAFKDR